MRIELLTPLHIGTGVEVPDFEYQWEEREKYLRRLSLVSLLSSDETLQRDPSHLTSAEALQKYLEEKKALWKAHTLYTLTGDGRFLDQERRTRRSIVVRECLKVPLTQLPLLPGSSLKGAMLTAWFFAEGWEKVQRTAPSKLLDINGIDFDGELPNFFCNSLKGGTNPEWGLLGGGNPDKLSDRLHLPDFILPGELRIYAVERKMRRSLPAQWIEGVAPQAIGEAQVRFDERGDSLRTVENLCRRSNQFAKCLIVAEQQFFDYCVSRQYLKERPSAYAEGGLLESCLETLKGANGSFIARIGWASNKNATSLTLLNSSADLRKQPGMRDARRRPKSRWMLRNGTPLGWCLVTFEERDHVKDR